MADKEMDVSLATGDSEPQKRDNSSDKQTDKKNDVDDKQTDKKIDLEITPQPLYGNHAAEEIQTELSDLPQDSHDKDLMADDHEKIQLELQTDSLDSHDTDDVHNTHATVFEDSPLSKSVDFMFETKYVMLNFMSLLPPEMYRGHISTSPEIESEGHQRFGKTRMHSLSKSKSFDISSHNRKPNLKYLGKLKSMQRRMDSPASEDNLSYHYKKNWKRLESPGCERFNSDPGSPQSVSELFEKHHSAHELGSVPSPAVSPRKSFMSPQRQFSDASSSGELSYMSDADDEYEEYSNASSIFSARSISSRDGFLDLRRSVHILPTLPSQSEDVDEADGFIPRLDDTRAGAESCNLGTVPEELKDDSKNETERDKGSLEALQQEVFDADGRSRVKQTADRSKLKLNIPCEPVQLDDILLSLHTELSFEMDEMESEFEEALQSARSGMSHSGIPTPLTPQSEAARVLARIGDEVKAQYGARLAAAVNGLTHEQINNLSYTQFRDIAQSVVTSEVPGWRQVALLMVFGQKIIWGAVQQGQTHFGNVIDYCSQLVAEVAADFIIKQGGWGSVMNFDPSSDTQGSTDFDTSPEMVVDFFTGHDVTQVESEKCIDDAQEKEANNKSGIGIDADIFVVLDKEQTYNDEPNITSGKELTVPTYKARYASSVGFEYADEIEDMAEEEIRSDSDVSVAFIQSFSVEANVDVTENGNMGRSREETDTQKSADEECFLEETIDGKMNNENEVTETPNDLTNKNIPSVTDSNDYNKDSVYVRQETPSATLFDSAVDGLHKDKDVNGNSVDKEPVSDNDSVGENTDSGRETPVNNSIVDATVVNCETEGQGGLKSNDSTNNDTVDNETMVDKESVNDSSSEDASTGNLADNVHRNLDGSGDFSTNTQAFPGDGEHSLDTDDLIDIGESNMNNNQSKAEIDGHTKDNSTQGDDNCEYQSDDNHISGTEVTEESHVPATLRRVGFRVAALSLAVLAVGIGVRFATVNR